MRASSVLPDGGDSVQTPDDFEALLEQHPDDFDALLSDQPADDTPLATARRYIAAGWSPVPVPLRRKKPDLLEWGRLRLTNDSAAQHFNCKPQNIGVILGEASGDLVDVDHDCREARTMAPDFLPATGAIFGRPSNPASHWLYRAPGLVTMQIRHPVTRKMLVELRSNSQTDQPAQTIFPGSVHEEGERISWHRNGTPAAVHPHELLASFKRLGAAALIAQSFPSQGGRHEATLALVGLLTRAGWDQDAVVSFVRSVRAAAGADPKKALRKMADDAANRFAADRSLYGLPVLIDAFGDKVAGKFCELIGYDPSQRSETTSDEYDDVADLPETEKPAADSLSLINPAMWSAVDVPERRWALPGWIPQGQATYLTGPGSAGKSLLSQQLATCIALGLPFLGIETTQARALYLTCEDDADELHRRQKAICDSLGVSVSDLSGRLFLASLAGDANTELCTFSDKGELKRSKRYESLKQAAVSNGITFMALDNTAHLFSGNENARHDVAAFVSLLNRLAMDIGGAVLFLGHPNKAGDSFSGSTAWENQVRSRLFLETPTEEDGSVIDRDCRILSRQKANYARNGETLSFRWHEWAFVNDSDLPWSESVAGREAAEDEVFLRCLDKSKSERRAVSPHPSAMNYAPRVFAKMASASGIGMKGFEGAMNRLLDAGYIANAQRIYQRDNRNWVLGLGRVDDFDDCTDGFDECTNPPHQPAPTLHQPPAPTCTNPAPSAHQPARTGPLYTTYIAGRALGAAHPAPNGSEQQEARP